MSIQDSQEQVEPYSELGIGSDEVLQIILTNDQKHLYVLSTHKVPNWQLQSWTKLLRHKTKFQLI